MRNDLRVADGMYIKRGLLNLEDFFLFWLYSFNCIGKQEISLKNNFDWYSVLNSEYEHQTHCLDYNITSLLSKWSTPDSVYSSIHTKFAITLHWLVVGHLHISDCICRKIVSLVLSLPICRLWQPRRSAARQVDDVTVTQNLMPCKY
jgi:hypothetical protein